MSSSLTLFCPCPHLTLIPTLPHPLSPHLTSFLSRHSSNNEQRDLNEVAEGTQRTLLQHLLLQITSQFFLVLVSILLSSILVHHHHPPYLYYTYTASPTISTTNTTVDAAHVPYVPAPATLSSQPSHIGTTNHGTFISYSYT